MLKQATTMPCPAGQVVQQGIIVAEADCSERRTDRDLPLGW